MPSMADILRACEAWTTPREASERVGVASKQLATQLRLAVRRGWAESRFEDGRGTVYRAVPGWESLMEGRERAPMPPMPSPVRSVILSILATGPKTTSEIAEALGRDPHTTATRLHQMRLQGLVESTPTGPRCVGRGGHRVIYTLKQTPYKEDPGMGDETKKSKESKPPCPSREAEECEMDPRNEP